MLASLASEALTTFPAVPAAPPARRLELVAGNGRRAAAHPAAPSSSWRGGFAAAAVFALLLGGLWSLRGLVARSGNPGGSRPSQERGFVPAGNLDAGLRPEAAEVHPPVDGVSAEATAS